jgi:DNA-binding NarL/FixJ family response regulator
VQRTVLIVDDHPSFRAGATAILRADGFDVVGEAENGLTALDEALRLQPDVVLLDVQLPDLDGFDVCKRLTARGQAPSIVLVSSRDAVDYAVPTRTCGALGFIPKDQLSGDTLSAILAV